MSTFVRWSLVAALLLPAAAAAQTDTDRLARVRASYSAEQAARIQEIADAARQDGVPAGPILDKAIEGAAKRVPPERVIPALSSYADGLRRVSRLLDRSDAPALVAAVDAVRRGVGPEALRDVARAADGRAPVAMVVMGDLVEAGVPTGDATDVVREALGRGHGGETLLDISGTVRRLMRGGRQPGEAAMMVRQAIRQGMPLRQMGPRGGPPGVDFRQRRNRPVPPGSGPKGGGPPGSGPAGGPPAGTGGA